MVTSHSHVLILYRCGRRRYAPHEVEVSAIQKGEFHVTQRIQLPDESCEVGGHNPGIHYLEYQ